MAQFAEDLIEHESLPFHASQVAGLIVADGWDAAMIRRAPDHPLPGATRKALLARIARLGAARLTALAYPDAVAPDLL